MKGQKFPEGATGSLAAISTDQGHQLQALHFIKMQHVPYYIQNQPNPKHLDSGDTCFNGSVMPADMLPCLIDEPA